MNCPNCKKEIPNEAKFCLHCGTKVEVDASIIECQSCHARIPKDSKFCPDCGNKIVQRIFQGYSLCGFEDGLIMAFKIDNSGEPRYDKRYYINKDGEIISQEDVYEDDTENPLLLGYEDHRDFREGFAAVRSLTWWGYIDAEGNQIIPDYRSGHIMVSDFGEGKAIVAIDGVYNKFAIINTNGEYIAKFDGHFDVEHSYFSCGRAIIYTYNGDVVILSNTGKLIYTEYDSAQQFSEGLAAVRSKDNGMWGFIDINNKVVIPFNYDAAQDFHDSFALVLKDGKWGYIRKDGACLTSFKYNIFSHPFHDGYATISIDSQDKQIYGIIDNHGNETF